MSEPTLPTPAEIEDLILGSPFHRWLGLTVAEVTPESVTIKAAGRPEWENKTGGVVHGGILASLLDLAADWALVGTVGTAVPTIDMHVQYLRAAPVGDLVATGHVIRPGRQVSAAEAQVHDGEGRLLAVGRGSYLSAVSEQVLASRRAQP